MKRAARLDDVAGFGIDRVAAAVTGDVLRLENLDTDLGLPPAAIEVTRRALEDPVSNSWLPFTGDLMLRDAISSRLAQRHGRVFDPETEIVVTCGGCEAVLDVLLATVDPGDEVVLVDPIYAGLVNRVRLAGGVPRFAPLRVQDGEWVLDELSVSDRTVALLMMSPSMPAGHVLTDADWRRVEAVCAERDLLLIYDAAMEDIVFDGRELLSPFSYPGLADRTVLIGSMSKMHRMIGWRVGWIAGPRGLVSDAGWVHVYNTTGAVSVSRRAAEAVLRGPQSHVAQATAELQRRRDTILAAVPGSVRPAGGWSLLVAADDPVATSAAMLSAGVAATPMVGWGDSVAARYVRFVFSAEPVARLQTLADRLAPAVLNGGQ
jgi:aspartate/methionine/tyrosine aminotransferase